MTWLAPKLRERVQILIPTQLPEDEGGLDHLFGIQTGESFDIGPFDQLNPVLTVWMEFKEKTFQASGAGYVRGEQVEETITHSFICRRIAVSSLGKTFSSAFDSDFDMISDLNPLKAEYYLLVQRGTSVKGRLFRIRKVNDVGERREYLKIDAEEIEERGTGYPS